MTIPTNNAGPQKTFWNTYAFHPSEAETKKGRFASRIGAVALGIFTLGLGHALSYYVARKPFKAQMREQMNKSVADSADATSQVATGRVSPKLTQDDIEAIQKKREASNQSKRVETLKQQIKELLIKKADGIQRIRNEENLLKDDKADSRTQVRLDQLIQIDLGLEREIKTLQAELESLPKE